MKDRGDLSCVLNYVTVCVHHIIFNYSSSSLKLYNKALYNFIEYNNK